MPEKLTHVLRAPTLIVAMSGEVSTYAPAKINLHLSVLGRRADGYHDILSLFQAVSLRDEIGVALAGGDGEITISGGFDFPAERNIISAAIRGFRRVTGLSAGFRVRVEKRIPLAAGLGGGSSDTAATLRCLLALFPGAISPSRIMDLGAELGSDVPFFLGPAAAIVEGRGERLTPLRPRTDYAVVAVHPRKGVPTREAYEWRDACPGRGIPLDLAAIRAAYEFGDVRQWPFFNDFDEPVLARLPEAAGAREALKAAGACAAGLTGSGSTVIGVFPDEAAAQRCARKLADGGRAAHVLLPLATIPPVC